MEGSYSRRHIQSGTYYSQQRVDARPFAKRRAENAPRGRPAVSSPKEATPDGQSASKANAARRKTARHSYAVGLVANGVAGTHGPGRLDALRQNLRIRTGQT